MKQISDGRPLSAPAEPPRIDSRRGFATALGWGFDAAIARHAQRIICCDPDFAEWSPLEDPAQLQLLAGWLKQPQRRLVLLARSFDDVPRRWPRFTAWRRQWQHALDAWQPPPEMASSLPTVLVADHGISVELFDALHWRGHASVDERRAHQLRQQIDAVLQRSEAAFAANILGL